ncbi:MAG TPA: hypothetical protein VK811_03530, partial [Candidatus Acidoferrum sp.]|nr:hypothetical protein [Candidatus Acidoferrum sp.]
RQQTNSGSFTLNVTSTGSLSGDLYLGSATPLTLSGKFDLDGTAVVTTKRRGASALFTTLTLDTNNQTVNGMVSDGSFIAPLAGDQAVFSQKNKAPYQGQYTLIMPGTTNAQAGPYGTSYGTVSVSASGAVTFAGSLADGTTVSRSSVVSKEGAWPFYLPLYKGRGSIFAWNYFASDVTNGMIMFSTNASWIKPTNSFQTALYEGGFTNQNVMVIGSDYNPANAPSVALAGSAGEVLLEGGNLSANITNPISLGANDEIRVTGPVNTNRLTLRITKSTGLVSGTFTDVANPHVTLKCGGVLLQSQTNAYGYFLGTSQSGTFLLDNP